MKKATAAQKLRENMTALIEMGRTLAQADLDACDDADWTWDDANASQDARRLVAEALWRLDILDETEAFEHGFDPRA